MMRVTVLIFVLSFGLSAWAQPGKPYDQQIDVQYGEAKWEPLYLDVFTPNGVKWQATVKQTEFGKGLGIIDVASGAWHADRGKIEEHEQAQMYSIFCSRGYTVFAVRPGSRPKFTALEMVENIKRGIRYVKAHAEEHGVDPNRLGITGASAGGHLASLTVLLAEAGDPDASDPLLRHGTEVKAAGVFFPPTDFLEWEGKTHAEMGELVGDIIISGGAADVPESELLEKARAVSPRHLVKEKTIPFMIFHGDADEIVPLQQSEVFVEALRAQGTDVELFVKPGGTHPWVTIPLEIVKLADWFDHQLAGGPAPERWAELWSPVNTE